MKKSVIIFLWCISIALSFFLGIKTTALLNDHEDKKDDYSTENTTSKTEELVGVYETDSWNGKPAVLILYEDGTSQYPSGGIATWEYANDVVILTVKGLGYDNGKQALTAYFNAELTENDMKTISAEIGRINNVEYVNLLVDEYHSRIYIKLIEDDLNEEAYNAISAIDGISSVEYEYREIETVTEYEAKVMENGIVLHGHFFKKVSG